MAEPSVASISIPFWVAAAPDFDALLWDIFLRLMDVPPDRVEAVILDAQRRLCRAIGLDRSSLFQVPHDRAGTLVVSHVFDAEHDQPDGPSLDGSVTQGSERVSLLSDKSVSASTEASDYFRGNQLAH